MPINPNALSHVVDVWWHWRVTCEVLPALNRVYSAHTAAVRPPHDVRAERW